MSNRVLVIEDDPELGAQIVKRLKDAGYEPSWWRAGRRLAPGDLSGVELVILDLMLPGAYGLDMLKDLRAFFGLDKPIGLVASGFSAWLGRSERSGLPV